MTTPLDAVPKTSLRARRRARTHDEILESVVHVFAIDGGSGAVIDQIATEAGLSRATLYSYFPGGVDELIAAAYDWLGEQFVQQAEERLRGLSDWRSRILTHAELMAEWGSDRYRGAFYNIVGPKLISATHPTGVGSQSTLRLVETELARAQEIGEVDEAVDPRSVAALLTGCVKVIGVESARNKASADSHLEALRALLRGLDRA
ncbi:TetR/AcrR family transcriptional regulator [Arthrobacter oryzae]|nr:TetR/AcrR family transcriptional regulator [Arthrobacter oryzae]